ncbi:MotA/TolQ/ExbB proton channel family protein [Gimesia sp.]|uniref:MotA/TolQ/ExbB proton channel family protein n=1 Tax=Gimesia sp. TaxID=2024833 RepID=UPI000C39E3A5|nr:MotA/TolQ/ExbB proton channel family protein [Gimesia sp.]MAX37914.1 peptide transporter TolQ [Gimesia sp.]HAH46999.1 MotA/TolQ/ExbB proton channel family protein [Planctomycetaceae bacterium]HBL48393.1 MotA/TolQ/ExbB proton channel family protein [Planctomycetaceae bacterium]|tara:strand:- start:217 stop:873 length:657 start_codon:yes stop_codon:yes gene_type:complete
MNYSLAPILNVAGIAIYVSLALIALYGVFCVILLVRQISQKRFMTQNAANEFLDQIHQDIENKDYESVINLCDSPPYWSKAVPQLILVAMANLERPAKKLRQMLAEKFERDILADLEYRMSWISTIVKSAPMLGLLGTVIGMINAFDKIGNMQESGGDPSQLAGEISFALFTTAAGLAVAIPLVMAGALIHVRIGKLQDSVQEHTGEFLEILEDSRKS